jgi:hypothetical protein
MQDTESDAKYWPGVRRKHGLLPSNLQIRTQGERC